MLSGIKYKHSYIVADSLCPDDYFHIKITMIYGIADVICHNLFYLIFIRPDIHIFFRCRKCNRYIWIKFYKVDKARTREYGGNGIGLSIVKAIMDSLGKECGVMNVDGGVEFWFDLDAKA